MQKIFNPMEVHIDNEETEDNFFLGFVFNRLNNACRMIYILSTSKSTYNLLIFDHSRSMDHLAFLSGSKLTTRGPLEYHVRKQSSVPQIPKHHMIESTGPTLFSEKLKHVVEMVAPDQAEFLAVNMSFKDQRIQGYYAFNPLYRLSCTDMAKSEYEQTNFDPKNPTYRFYYQALLEEILYGIKIAICEEYPEQIVVDQAIKDKCFSLGLGGLEFCKSVDITPADRSECETVSATKT